MSSPNRKTAPSIFETPFPRFDFPKISENNGVDGFFIKVIEPISRLDLVFNTGILHQDNKVELSACLDLLFSGTHNKNQQHLLEELDSLGAFTDFNISNNHSTITLYSTPQLMLKSFQLLLEVLSNTVYPSDKLKLYSSKKISELRQNREKTTYQAGINMTSMFYTTPILKNKTNENDYNVLSQKRLKNTLSKLLDCKTVLYLTSSEDQLEKLSTLFSSHLPLGKTRHQEFPQIADRMFQFNHSLLPRAVQTSFRLRIPVISATHKDYPALYLSNVMLGGYFGSLLMKNIREEKGLTYGISSQLVSNIEHGFVHISAEIKSESAVLVFREIQKEIHAIANGEFDIEYFLKTKSYLRGLVSKKADNLFDRLERTQTINNNWYKHDFYNSLYQSIDQLKPDDCTQATIQYLLDKDYIISTSGSEQYEATSFVK